MKTTPAMIAAARAAMIHALDLVADDAVLVVTDDDTAACGQAFAAAARELGCDTTLRTLTPAERRRGLVPPALAALVDDRHVVINAVVGDVAEMPLRLKWLQLLEASPVIRVGHSPGITPGMMVDGPLAVDYGRMGVMACSLLDAFRGAVSARITTALGTDLALDLAGRRMVSDLRAAPGAGVNLPCGEVFCCPVETGADGVLVVDGCFGSFGTVPAPLTLRVKGGRVTSVECRDAATLKTVMGLMDTDAGARTIAELGVGLNPGARLTDRMLEAEKALGTAHVAFGDNQGMPGGRSHSAVHVDYLFTGPTIIVTDDGGAERIVLQDGRRPDAR